MADSAPYLYGPVSDYSIKMQMDAWSTGRWFTWGRAGVAPVAALNATSGNFQTAGSVTASSFVYSSDRSLKDDITPLQSPLEKILSLSGYTFTWKANGQKDIGIIAQEVEKVFPELVHTDTKTGLKSVEYGNLVAPLIESVKSQQKTIEEQDIKIQNLEARLDKLEKLLEAR